MDEGILFCWRVRYKIMKSHCSPLRLVSTWSMWSAEYCELQSVIVEHTCRTSRSRTRDIEIAPSHHSGRRQCSPFCTHLADVPRRKPSRCFSTIRDPSRYRPVYSFFSFRK